MEEVKKRLTDFSLEAHGQSSTVSFLASVLKHPCFSPSTTGYRGNSPDTGTTDREQTVLAPVSMC